MTFAVRVSLLVPAFALIAGCVSSELAPNEGTSAQAVCTQVVRAGGVIPLNSSCTYPWVGQQGRLLQGEVNPDLRNANPTDTTLRAKVDSGTGHITLTDTAGNVLPDDKLLSTSFTASGIDGTTATLNITAVYPPNADPADPNYGRYQYVVTQADGSSLCAQPATVLPPQTPLATPIRAIAENGLWLGNGLDYPHAAAISFACRTGVIAKCDRWGYGPDTVWPSVTAHGAAIHEAGVDMNQTCTRMARADYCSQGLPNTLDGTPIYIEDNFHLRVPQPGYYPEAAWRDFAWSDGRTSNKPVVCLSKLRWSTLPLGGDCPLTVPDPRVTRKARFCEDYTDAEFDAAGAVLFSSSSFIDVGLYTWSDPSSGQHLTTTKLQPSAYPSAPVWSTTPPPGTRFPLATPPSGDPRFEATLLSMSLPDGFDTSSLITLSSYTCNGGAPYTSAIKPATGCDWYADEGRLYPPNTPGYAPLRRWRNQDTGLSWTTVASPTTMWRRKLLMGEVIGGVVRASLDVNVRWTAVPSTTYALDIQLRTGEWIANCVAAATIGTATSWTYTGSCPDAAGRAVNHNDIVAFRMNYNGHYATQPYDGISSDAYIPAIKVSPALTADQVKASQITALTLTWKDLGNAVYGVVVSDGSVTNKCATYEFLANDTSYIHTGTCPTGYAVPAYKIASVQLCAYDKTTHALLRCTDAKLDGKTSSLALSL